MTMMMVDRLELVKTSTMKNVSINFTKNSVPNVCIYIYSLGFFFDDFHFCKYLVGTASPGWDASLSEHVLKNLRGTEVRYSEKDLQDNLTLLETKLR